MADPEKTQVATQLIKTGDTVPPPDNLIAGNRGAVYTDIIKLSAAGDFKRGTVLMSGADGYVASTQAGLATASGICILCDDITIGDTEYAEVPAYFEGDFNDERVIFPFEGEEDDHDAIVEAVREPLRKAKIFLRHMHK